MAKPSCWATRCASKSWMSPSAAVRCSDDVRAPCSRAKRAKRPVDSGAPRDSSLGRSQVGPCPRPPVVRHHPLRSSAAPDWRVRGTARVEQAAVPQLLAPRGRRVDNPTRDAMNAPRRAEPNAARPVRRRAEQGSAPPAAPPPRDRRASAPRAKSTANRVLKKHPAERDNRARADGPTAEVRKPLAKSGFFAPSSQSPRGVARRVLKRLFQHPAERDNRARAD